MEETHLIPETANAAIMESQHGKVHLTYLGMVNAEDVVHNLESVLGVSLHVPISSTSHSRQEITKERLTRSSSLSGGLSHVKQEM